MGWCLKISLLLFTVSSAVLYNFLNKTYELPKFDENEYWGPGLKEKKYVPDKTVRSFAITYPKEQIDQLRQKLSENYPFTPALEGTELHENGMDAHHLERIVKYWRDEYMPKWIQRLKLFNSLPHFKTEIQGLNIHFIHAKPAGSIKGKTVIPLLLLHGWPGSVREFYDFIPMLTSSNDKLDVAFEVIAPSLPGYGWSDGTNKKGLNANKIAVILRNLMLRLGHKKFIIQGGDWGSIIGSSITTLFPQNVLAYHSNMCFTQSPKSTIKLFIADLYPSYFIPKEYESFTFPALPKLKTLAQETGYFHLQTTKPDTIGHALVNNPVGLAAYVLEKYNRFWETIGPDAVLDNLMIYYLNNKFTTATRLYAEVLTIADFSLNVIRIPTAVPTACARFRVDLTHLIDWQLQDKYTNLIQSTYHPVGGHFAAFEVPKTLYTDFVQFIQKYRDISI